MAINKYESHKDATKTRGKNQFKNRTKKGKKGPKELSKKTKKAPKNKKKSG